MKKRVLSMLMALVLCLTLLPTAALADELGPVDGTSTVETAGADAEAEAKAKAGAEAVATVQAMIDALPDALTEENAGDVSAMLGKIDAAMAALGDEERAALNLTQYQAVIAALAALAAAQGEIALYADENNKPKGEGTKANPYQITSNKELEWFRDTVNAGETGICAELMDDLNFKDETGWTWTPIVKDAGKAYTGTFNGNGYKIKMDYAVAPDGMTAGWGLFGSIGNDGKVQDLDIYLTNFGWKGNAFSISESGMLAAYNSGTIERCTAMSGKINVSNGVGLLVYQNNGTIQDCWTKHGTVVGGGNLIGGVAYTNNGHIKNCFFNSSYNSDYLNNHTIAFEKGKSGSIENCYFILGRKHTDNTVGVTGVEQADANSGKLTVKLNNNGNERGSEVDPWRIGSGSTNRYPSLKKTDYRVSLKENGGYNIGDKPHMHGNVEFTKVTALSEIKKDGNYYISGAIALNSTWEVDKKILLCLDGQTITAASGVDPAIKIVRGGSLTLVDGSKTGGGKITGGATGVMLDGGAFTMQGGEISGNTVGVDVKSGDLTLGGKAQVAGNDKNILLAANQKIHFDSLDPSAKFGISVAGQESLSDRVAVTDTTGGQYFAQLVADGFKNDGSGFELYLNNDGNTVMLGKQSVHTHCICGGGNANLGHTSHSDVIFQPWTETDKLPTSGNYYLTRNVTLTGNAGLKDANVCLNGYTVTLSDVGRINPSGTTQLTDCSVNGKLESYPGKANGGVTISGGSKFYLYGGTLNGVKVEIGQTGGGTFNMYGGKITGNTKGTVVGQDSQQIYINMYGGEISGNHIDGQYGGGVFVGNGNQFKMYGGKIQNNSAVDGGGVYIAPKGPTYQAGTMTIRGDAVIQDNKANGVTNNVSLPKGSTIKIDGQMNESAQIGVTTKAGPSAGTVTIATATDTGWVAAKNFTSDNSAYHVGLVNDGKTVQLQVHSHQWAYSVSPDGTTITAKCTAGNCDLENGNGGSVTIKAPDKSTLTYTGQGHPAKLDGQFTTGIPTPAITYIQTAPTQQTLESGATPTNAGTYTASITLDNATASVEYTIEKATPRVLSWMGYPRGWTFRENTPIADPTELTIANGTFRDITRFEWYNASKNADDTYTEGTKLDGNPTDAGDYIIKAVFEESNNVYAAADALGLTIRKAEHANNGRSIEVPLTVYPASGEYIYEVDIAKALENIPHGGGLELNTAYGGISTNLTLVKQTKWDNGKLKVTMKPLASITGTTLGSITVILTSKNYTVVPVVVNITLQPKREVQDISVSMDNWTYGEKAKTPQYPVMAGAEATVTYAAQGSSDFSTTVPTNAGNYTVKVQYEAAIMIHTGTANFTIAPKTLTKDDLTYSGPISKVYDGNTNAPSGLTVSVKPGSLVGSDTLAVSGTLKYNSANVNEAKQIIFTPTAITTGNYALAATEMLTITGATITQADQAPLTVTSTAATYGADLALTVSGGTGDGAVSYTVTNGTGEATIVDGSTLHPTKAGQVSVTATKAGGDNYKDVTSPVAAITIAKASYGGKGIPVSAKIGSTKTVDLTAWIVPGGSLSYLRKDDNFSVVENPSLDGSIFSFTVRNSEGVVEKVAYAYCQVSSDNYADYVLTIKITANAKNKQTGFKFENGSVTKTYGDEDFTLAATGEVKGSIVTYESNAPAVAEVDSATGKVTIKGAGTAVITAKASATEDYDEAAATCTLTVEKKPIAIPAADATVYTYNGTEQTYALAEDGAYTITGNKQTNANETGYAVTVALKDTANTQWADGTTANKTYTFVIGKAVITVKAKDQTAYVGDKAPALGEDSYTVSGLVGEEKLTTQPTVKYVDADGKESAPDMNKTGEVNILASGAAASDNYTIRYENGKLTVSTRPSSGSSSNNSSYTVSVDKTENGAITVSPKSASKGDTVTITVKPDKGYELDTLKVLDKNGDKVKLTEKNGKYTFTMPAGKVTVKGSFVEEDPEQIFADVPVDAYYYEAVKWAVEKDITGGIGNGLFAPKLNCTRAQIVTFLWRAAGSPEPKSANSFADVSADSYYAKAVAWAVENGITGGTGNGKFSPNATCTREQAVVFLYRASSSPAVSGGSAFSDVAASAYYADAVAWAEKNGVTGGIGGGLFGSGSDCTRAQIVTFLYRTYQGK
ncbi:S-layer homology domain-containing protein [Pseudoflavonifractor sp. MSJ-37]|uniref:S-layer homology domain-containing protein n=1 Tax=Pseudoflavonifractor sp. MSJ-37 TaxID=2841531 RepID=UPI001C117905|nr:S-layer homology domain-containing protein [Pseudoflavonifractor sp. MSJ-37]MBU5434423.1 S-layer homology domain-containing protein [Pseudoflavonifractor sp. MSJ-37]